MKLFNRNKGRTSFLERNQMIIGVLGAAFVLAGSAFSLLLSGGAFANTYSVSARFADAAGLKPNDKVKVAGLDAGTIESIEIQGGEVVVEMKIDHDVILTQDSEAEIAIETLLGKKNVTIHNGDGPHRLTDGDEIALENTRTPVSLIELNNTSVDLLEASDADALETFMVEITKITQGKREDIINLVEGFGDTAAAIDNRRAELGRLLDSLRTLSATFAERDDTLISLIDNFDVVLGNLAQRTDDLRVLLESTDSASHKVADLVRENRPALDGALRGLNITLKSLDKRQLELAAGVSYLHDAVRGYQSVGYSQGVPNRWANIFVQSLGPVGMDAAFGPCGALDQALDQLLGPDPRDCDERHDYGEPEESEGKAAKDGVPQEETPEETAEDLIDELVPGDIGDFLDGVTGTYGLSDALRGGLL